MDRDLRLGLVGIAGYANEIGHLLQSPNLGDDANTLSTIFVPDPERHPQRIAELKRQGVRCVDSYAALLASGIDAVWLPVPIHLHRPMTEQALAAGVAVICEKPVAGTIDEWHAMKSAQDRAGLPVFVGFQHVYESATHRLKQRVLDARGRGPIRASLVGARPRGSDYFGRNDWAGHIQRGEHYVLDSPLNNAMAHAVNLAVFLMGPRPNAAAEPSRVEAELYRVNAIENYDTVSLRAGFTDGSELVVTLTHACPEPLGPRLRLRAEGLDVLWDETEAQARCTTPDGGIEWIARDERPREAMVRRLLRRLRDGSRRTDEGVATLETARPHTVLVNGVSQAATIHNVPDEFVQTQATRHPHTLRHIAGISAALSEAERGGRTLHELGTLPWTQPAGGLNLAGYRRFAGPAVAVPG
ncbi:MAG: Gfo/Idh/MocA family oxidoreductase [Planctomycetota bacterium]